MNLSELRTDAYDYLRATSSGLYTAAKVNAAINRAQKRICRDRNWRFLRKTARLTVVSTQIATAVVAGGVTLVVDSATGMGKNRWLYVVDGSSSEEVQILSISSNTITLTAATAFENAHAVDVYVVMRDVFLPVDCGRIKTIRLWGGTQTRLKNTSLVPFDHAYPQPQSMGSPSRYTQGGVCRDVEGPLTADATTSTTAIVDSALTAAAEDYYKDWMAVNQTVNLSARITAYAVSSKTLSLDRVITGQVAGNTYQVSPELEVITVYPFPTANTYLRLRYLIEPMMVNDYSLPVIPEAHHRIISLGALQELALKDRTSPTAMIAWKSFKEEYKEALGEMEDDDSIRAVDAAEYYGREDDDWNAEEGL